MKNLWGAEDEPRSGRYAGCEQVGAGFDTNRIAH